MTVEERIQEKQGQLGMHVQEALQELNRKNKLTNEERFQELKKRYFLVADAYSEWVAGDYYDEVLGIYSAGIPGDYYDDDLGSHTDRNLGIVAQNLLEAERCINNVEVCPFYLNFAEHLLGVEETALGKVGINLKHFSLSI